MSYDFAFTISDVADILHLEIVRRNSVSMDVNCPFCGDKRGKMNVNFEKNVFRCNYCGESGGMIGLYAKLMNISNSDAYRDICEILKTPNYPVKREVYKTSISREKMQTATPEQLHQTYTTLFSMFTLSENHRQNLMFRGLSDEQIERFGFKSVPTSGLDRYIPMLIERRCAIQGVPGFYYDKTEQKWKMKLNCSGIVIPVKTVGGLTAGAQVRLDTPFNGCKYLWFSSSNENMGVSSGSPVGFVGDSFDKTVYITEGYLKAVTAHCLSGLTFAAVAGANNYRNLAGLFDVLQQNGVEEIVEAYDMDKFVNPQVESGCQKLVHLAEQYSLKVRRIRWNEQFKGIDDYFKSFKNI